MNRTGTLSMPDGCCSDMAGAIALFRRIDPKVRRIVTLSGEERDTVYYRSKGEWEARL